MTAEFVNNKACLATKVSLFIANYGKKLRIEADIRRKSRKGNIVCKKNEESIEES